jgi:flagellar hook-basal body complex protein FliE
MKPYKFPNIRSTDPEEKRLAQLFQSYVGVNKEQYDPEFVKILKQRFGWMSQKEKAAKNKQDIIKWIEEHS